MVDDKLISLIDYIDNLINDYNFKNNLYFQSLSQGNFKKEDFIETQIQFYTVIRFFPKFLAEVISKLPESDLKLSIVENFYQDHNSNLPGNSFLDFLNKLQISKLDVDKRELWPETRIFIMALLGTCALDNIITACAALGVIEYMFLYVSETLEKILVKTGWLEIGQIRFYLNHEKLDRKHSQDFFNVILKSWHNPESKYYVTQGLKLGAYSFNSLFNELYQDRQLRLFRSIPQDHIALY
jgi:pyrroloquinoline quinone (PQQ) biosynthesis protein C